VGCLDELLLPTLYSSTVIPDFSWRHLPYVTRESVAAGCVQKKAAANFKRRLINAKDSCESEDNNNGSRTE